MYTSTHRWNICICFREHTVQLGLIKQVKPLFPTTADRLVYYSWKEVDYPAVFHVLIQILRRT